MRSDRFQYLLEQERDGRGRRLWTVERLAQAICSNRAHVNQVLNNKPGRGHQTRRKLVGVLKSNFESWREMLAALGWTESGELVPQLGPLVPQGTLHV